MNRNINVYYFLIAVLSILNLFILLREIDKRDELIFKVKEVYCIEILSKQKSLFIQDIKVKCSYYAKTGEWND